MKRFFEIGWGIYSYRLLCSNTHFYTITVLQPAQLFKRLGHFERRLRQLGYLG